MPAVIFSHAPPGHRPPSLRGVGSTSRRPACKPYGLASGS